MRKQDKINGDEEEVLAEESRRDGDESMEEASKASSHDAESKELREEVHGAESEEDEDDDETETRAKTFFQQEASKAE